MKLKEENDAEQTNENSEEVLTNSYPCGKQCAYCQLFRKSQGQATVTKRFLKSVDESRVNLEISCMKCKLQGIAHSTHFGKRISNYFSHINK